MWHESSNIAMKTPPTWPYVFVCSTSDAWRYALVLLDGSLSLFLDAQRLELSAKNLKLPLNSQTMTNKGFCCDCWCSIWSQMLEILWTNECFLDGLCWLCFGGLTTSLDWRLSCWIGIPYWIMLWWMITSWIHADLLDSADVRVRPEVMSFLELWSSSMFCETDSAGNWFAGFTLLDSWLLLLVGLCFGLNMFWIRLILLIGVAGFLLWIDSVEC